MPQCFVIRIKCNDCFDQPDGANGKQIFSFFYICLIFFDNMSYEPEIMLNQDMLGI